MARRCFGSAAASADIVSMREPAGRSTTVTPTRSTGAPRRSTNGSRSCTANRRPRGRCSMRSCSISGSPSTAIEAAARVAAACARRATPPTSSVRPYTLLGTLDQLADEILQHHERWGFTSYVVRANVIDAAAALIDRLRALDPSIGLTVASDADPLPLADLRQRPLGRLRLSARRHRHQHAARSAARRGCR